MAGPAAQTRSGLCRLPDKSDNGGPEPRDGRKAERPADARRGAGPRAVRQAKDGWDQVGSRASSGTKRSAIRLASSWWTLKVFSAMALDTTKSW